jgi:hypothetical protein
LADLRAETLLKSALEKIVYFEARVEQVTRELSQARAEVEELKRDLSSAGARELELRRQVAELEVGVQKSHREREEVGRMNDALKSERTALLEKLIDASRIHAAGEVNMEPTLDLASFIAELRSEVISAREQRSLLASAPTASRPTAPSTPVAFPSASIGQTAAVRPPLAPEPSSSSPVAQVAEQLLRDGRLQVSADELTHLAPHAGRSEETLFGFSVRELSSPDSQSRIRAAERLRALGQRAAAPALATALHSEREPEVLVGLLSAFSSLAQREGAPVVLPLLESPSPEVRMAALKALLALDPSQAGVRLAAAAEDPDPAVRRRASLLSLGLSGAEAERVEKTATQDQDPNVRRLSTLTLAASAGERAKGPLLDALKDPDVSVRRAAALGLGQLLGEDLSHVVDLEDAPRRREIRRLAALPPKPRGRTGRAEQRGLAPAQLEDPAPEAHLSEGRRPDPRLPEAMPVDHEGLCQRLLFEMRSAIRGRSLEDLTQSMQEQASSVEDACGLLVARGQAVRRGLKYFVA